MKFPGEYLCPMVDANSKISNGNMNWFDSQRSYKFSFALSLGQIKLIVRKKLSSNFHGGSFYVKCINLQEEQKTQDFPHFRLFQRFLQEKRNRQGKWHPLTGSISILQKY